MAKNHIKPGKVVDDYTASGTSYLSGDLLKVGELAGVALGDIADTKTGVVQVEEVFEVPKLSTDVMGKGVSVYLDEANKRVTLSAAAGANIYAGKTFNAAGNGVTKVMVKLNA
ncbi:MAG: capsid cement protein [Solimonas sp.]